VLLSHLVLDATLNIDSKGLSMLIEGAKEPKFLGLGKILSKMVLPFKELMQLRKSLVLLHSADFDPIGKVVNSWLVITNSPDFGLENLDRDLSSCFS